MKTTSRSSIIGKNTESHTALWFDARIAGPSAGMFSLPRIHGR